MRSLPLLLVLIPLIVKAHECTRIAEAQETFSALSALSLTMLVVCADFSGPAQFPGELSFCVEYNKEPVSGRTCCTPEDEEYVTIQ